MFSISVVYYVVLLACNCNLISAFTCDNDDECNGNGFCIHSICRCLAGWSGSRCDLDENECSSENGGCLVTCVNTPGSFYCGCANSGYRPSNAGFTCVDADECTLGTDTCDDISSTCANTDGSFTCNCKQGYQSNGTINTCTDIDECVNGSHECDDFCVNTVGSYLCYCLGDNQILLNDGRTCSYVCSEDSECNGPSNGRCDTSNTSECICVEGREGADCSIDVNECERGDNGQCEQVCTNTAGSYTCGCTEGFIVDPINSFQCSDVNECEGDDNGQCTQLCNNTVGSYFCDCRNGFIVDPVNSFGCIDVNECERDDNGQCTQLCNNTVGSYFCECRWGYIVDPVNSFQCIDVNECEESNGEVCDPNSNCLNSVGSFTCQCREGFFNQSDGDTSPSGINQPSFSLSFDPSAIICYKNPPIDAMLYAAREQLNASQWIHLMTTIITIWILQYEN